MKFFFSFLLLLKASLSAVSSDEETRGESLPAEVAKKIADHSRSCSWKETYYDLLPKIINQHAYKTFLEVGVALGGHAEEILSSTAVAYLGIDPYRCYDGAGSFEQEIAAYSSAAPQRNFDYLFQWVKEEQLQPFGERCKLLRKTALEASREIADESVDCMFIDGDHRYEAVMEDLIALFPKLKKGGLMVADDYSIPPVATALDQFAAMQGKETFFFTADSGYKLWAIYK